MPRQQHAGDAAKPALQELVERFVGDEVVSQRPSLGPQFLARGPGFFRVPSQVQCLMVLQTIGAAGFVAPFLLLWLLAGKGGTIWVVEENKS